MINWLRKAAAQALDLAAEAYGALATWCVRTSEQLDPYTEDDYRHAQQAIADAAKAMAEDGKVFPRAELRDTPSYWFNDSDWQPRAPRDGGEHHYVNGVCTCGWPTGIHPSETGDE